MDKNFQIIKKLQENLKVDPNNVELLNEIAIYYFRIENLIQSEFYYKKALTIDPNNITIDIIHLGSPESDFSENK